MEALSGSPKEHACASENACEKRQEWFYQPFKSYFIKGDLATMDGSPITGGSPIADSYDAQVRLHIKLISRQTLCLTVNSDCFLYI